MTDTIDNKIPDRGFKRLTYSIGETFSAGFNDHVCMYEKYIRKPLEKTPFACLSKINSKVGTACLSFLIVAGTIYLAPGQAIGLVGFGIAYLAARMKKARNHRSTYSIACGFFSAQYLTDLGNGFAGFVSATSAMLRGSLLTIIPDSTEENNNSKLRAGISAAFALTSMAAVGTACYLTGTLAGLMLFPAFALAAVADYMGDDRSHTLRFWKFLGFSIVVAYDFLVSHNYGSGLAMLLTMGVQTNTSIEDGDFRKDNGEKHSIGSYLKSLAQPKLSK